MQESLLIFFPYDRGGVYQVIDSDDPVDNIEIFEHNIQDYGTIKVRRIVDGRWRAAWSVTDVNGTNDQTSRIQALHDFSKVNEIVVDVPVRINGTLNLTKPIRFEGNGSFLGNGTINISSYLSTGLSNVFSDTLTVNEGIESASIIKKTITASSNAFISVAKGRLVMKAIVIPTLALTDFRIGITVNGSELIASQPVAAEARVFDIDYPCITNTSIHFSGITSPTKIILYHA